MNEEANNAEKTLVEATISILPFVTKIFLMVNLSFITVLSRAEIATSDVVGFTFADKIVGIKLAWFVQALATLAAFGSSISNIFAMSRLSLCAAREGHFSKLFGYIYKSKKTQITACLGLSVLTLVFLFLSGNNIRNLVYMSGLLVWLTHTACSAAVPVLRVFKPELHRPFKINIVLPMYLFHFYY